MCDKSTAGGVTTFTTTTIESRYMYGQYNDYTIFNSLTGHRVYIRYDLNPGSNSATLARLVAETSYSSTSNIKEISNVAAGVWTSIKFLTTLHYSGSSTTNGPALDVRFASAASVGYQYYIKNYTYIDFTKLFGSDDNICAALGVSDLIVNGTLTSDDTKLNTAIANFEKLFPQSYYAYGKDICFVSRYLLIYIIKESF